jgi:hypothetical protein
LLTVSSAAPERRRAPLRACIRRGALEERGTVLRNWAIPEPSRPILVRCSHRVVRGEGVTAWYD